MYDPNVVVAVAGGATVTAADLRSVRGSPWGTMDVRFVLIALFFFCAHIGGLYYIGTIKLPPPKAATLEEIPERLAKFIVEKPIPKVKEKPVDKGVGAASPEAGRAARQEAAPEAGVSGTGQASDVKRAAAQRAVSQRIGRVESKVRTVGILGMLSGVGSTAKGPAVVDVLGAVSRGKERPQDLEKALENMTGIVKARDVGQAETKLVKSKDVAVSHTESIDNLIAGIGAAKTADLAKQGSFVIQKPEAIEGAASSSAKRDQKAINGVVAARKAGINMTYQKFLDRDPALSGKVTVRFTITAGGEVSNVEVLENTTGNPDFEREIVQKVRMWRFEPIPEGEVTVTYPFVFRPS